MDRDDIEEGYGDMGGPDNSEQPGSGDQPANGEHPGPRVRRDIWELEAEQPWHPITRAYAGAIRVMQRRPPGDFTSWAYQAAIHGTDENPDDWRNQCQHNSWFFLPWHRMYLYWFEEIVRAAVQELDDIDDDTKAAWALPYWNYDRGTPTNTLPQSFRDQLTPEGEPNPLFVAQRSRAINLGGGLPDGPFGITSPAGALAEPQFAGPPDTGVAAGFGGPQTGWHHFDESGFATPGAAEQTPHNAIHGAVGGRGGFMSGFDTAPLDPVFWLHHCNVDRLWAVWMKQPGRTNPTEPGWAGEVFHFHDAAGTDVTQTSDRVVDTVADLGYTYADITPPVSDQEGFAVTPSAEPPGRPSELVGATDFPIELTGDPVAASMALSAPSAAFRAGPAEPQRVYLNVEGIQGEQNPGVSYAVFVNMPDDEEATVDEHFVGHVSFFGIEKASGPDSEHPGGLRYAFDISRLYRRLKARDAWDEANLKVSFRPVRVQMPEDAAFADVGPEPEPPVTVGRVSVFYQ